MSILGRLFRQAGRFKAPRGSDAGHCSACKFAGRQADELGFGCQWTTPESESVFGFGYSGKLKQTTDVRFALPDYHRLCERSWWLPDGPERLAVLERANRPLIAQVPYKFNLHRVVNALLKPWLAGRLRHPFSVPWSGCVDIDVSPRDAPMGEA